jgi:protein O-GlcNAc transferase
MSAAAAETAVNDVVPPSDADLQRLACIRNEARRLQEKGEFSQALELHREALRVAPQFAGIWVSAALLADALGEQWTSLTFFEEAARLNPGLLIAVESARRICVAAGLIEKAAHYSQLTCALAPSDDIRIARALLLPAIQPSMETLHATRSTYERNLDDLIRLDLKLSDPAALQLGGYFLAYHGENDAALQAKTARFLTRAIADLSVTAAHCKLPVRASRRIRVGFISKFFFGHSIGATSRGLIQELSRERFEVIVLRITPTRCDAVSDMICATADRSLELDADFRSARQQIAALELDILFYQDIGMEPTSYLLACSRLAPVQCVSFGHPNTTGIPTIDYFISNDWYEPENAAMHYTEKLFLLEHLPTLAYYYRPAMPVGPPDRAEFGLRAAEHVYLCPQALCKIHPEFDAILGEILRSDRDGVLVLLRGGYRDYAERLEQRMQGVLRENRDRVRFLDAMPFPRFMRLMACADVCLDTLHFNGMNSSLEALALGIPIVTLPGRMQRGRHTQAMYRKMNILDCIAKDPAEYVRIAVRLGTDQEYATAIGTRIRAASHLLFEDPRVIMEFERFFLDVCRPVA